MSRQASEASVVDTVRSLKQSRPIDARNDFETNRENAWKRTAKVIEACFENGEYKVIKSAPGTGKTYSLFQYAQHYDTTVILALANYELIEEKVAEAENQGLDAFPIKSADQVCPTFNPDHKDHPDGDWKERVDYMTKTVGLSPSSLHKWVIDGELTKTGESEPWLPCCREGKCEYSEQFDADYDSFDVIVTTHGMLHHKLIEDRNVAIDEFADDSYVSNEIRDVPAIVNNFLEFMDKHIDVPFQSYDDLAHFSDMSAEQKNETQQFRSAMETLCTGDEQDGGNQWLDFCRAKTAKENNKYHVDAPKFVETIFHGEKVGQSRIHKGTIFDDYVVRINGGSAEVLERPPLELANAAIGLDATASEYMWQMFCHTKMDVMELTNEVEKAVLWQQNGGRVFKVAKEGARYACGGSSVPGTIPRATEAIQTATDIVYNGDTLVFSTKNVKENTDLDVDRYFGKDDRGMNNMSHYETMVVAGTPHPGDTAIVETCEWFEIEVDTEGLRKKTVLDGVELGPDNVGANMRYSKNHDDTEAEIIDAVQDSFIKDAIEQAIWRVNRLNDRGSDVFLVTDVQPNWLPVKERIEPHSSVGEKHTKLMQLLKDEGPMKSETALRRFEEVYGESIPENYPRRTFNKTEPYCRFVGKKKAPSDRRKALWYYKEELVETIAEAYSKCGVRKVDVPTEGNSGPTTHESAPCDTASEIEEFIRSKNEKLVSKVLTIIDAVSANAPE